MPLNWFRPYRNSRVGPARRLLKPLGPTWMASPWRRLVQVASLLTFLWLFLYVCWPYTARQSRNWPGWVPVAVDEASGRATVVAEQGLGNHPAIDTHVFAVEGTGPKTLPLGELRVAEIRADGLVLEPCHAPSQAEIDRLAMSIGPWGLHESEPGSWPSHYADSLLAKEAIPAEFFLMLDPLVSLSTTLASRTWIWSLVCAGVLLAVCLLIPRGFCGYLCPLGTLIDTFDWLVGKCARRFRLPTAGWWCNLRYYLLLATLVAAACGVVLSGFVAAIPIITRGLVFLVKPLQTAAERGWHQVPAMTPGQWLSVLLLALVFGLGLLGPRFWCRHVCPTGAIFSLVNLFRLSERKVADQCNSCGKCVDVCPYGAINDDLATNVAACSFCQTCGGTCPVGAVNFSLRRTWAAAEQDGGPDTDPSAVPRRRFLATTVGSAAAALGGVVTSLTVTAGSSTGTGSAGHATVRPPGSVPEQTFLRMCIRCGECLQACPNDVLQPSGFEGGLDGLWTPRVEANWSGCEPSCNNCGQVCPTGAIRPLPLEEKRVARMGLAVVNQQTCLPYAGQGDCQLCVDECATAGYHAIEFVCVGTQLDTQGQPIADSGFLAPVVLADRCVGCGLCQTRCHGINVTQKGLLTQSAIVIEAGEGKADRLLHGSYLALRRAERYQQTKSQSQQDTKSNYLPNFLK